MIGLVGFAIGAHESASSPLADWRKVRLIAIIFNIGGAFFASVVGGWIAARLAGLRRSEPAAVHGAISWLLTVPLLLAWPPWAARHDLAGGTQDWRARPSGSSRHRSPIRRSPRRCGMVR
jgi:hypothetical protein